MKKLPCMVVVTAGMNSAGRSRTRPASRSWRRPWRSRSHTQRVVGELEHAVLRPLVGEAVVDLVRDHPGPEATEGGRARSALSTVPVGLGGRVDEQPLGPRAVRPPPRAGGGRRPRHPPARRRARRPRTRRSSGGGVAGIREAMTRRPGVEQRAEEQQHRGRRARGHQDLLGPSRRSGCGQVWRSPRATAGSRGCGRSGCARPRPSRPPRATAGVGLAELQVNDVDALPLERLGRAEDLDGQERLDLLRAPRDDCSPPSGRAPAQAAARGQHLVEHARTLAQHAGSRRPG